MVRMPRILAVLAVAAVAATALTGCGSSQPPAIPGVVRVVAGENFWGNIAAQIGGRHVRVISILTSPTADPHLYESDVANAVAVAEAGLVIENGAGYDDFLSQLLGATRNPGRVVVSAQEVLGATGPDVNPHFWYDIPRVPQVARAIEAALARLEPGDAGAFAAGPGHLRHPGDVVPEVRVHVRPGSAQDLLGRDDDAARMAGGAEQLGKKVVITGAVLDDQPGLGDGNGVGNVRLVQVGVGGRLVRIEMNRTWRPPICAAMFPRKFAPATTLTTPGIAGGCELPHPVGPSRPRRGRRGWPVHAACRPYLALLSIPLIAHFSRRSPGRTGTRSARRGRSRRPSAALRWSILRTPQPLDIGRQGPRRRKKENRVGQRAAGDVDEDHQDAEHNEPDQRPEAHPATRTDLPHQPHHQPRHATR